MQDKGVPEDQGWEPLALLVYIDNHLVNCLRTCCGFSLPGASSIQATEEASSEGPQEQDSFMEVSESDPRAGDQSDAAGDSQGAASTQPCTSGTNLNQRSKKQTCKIHFKRSVLEMLHTCL